jgi:hypothetical protein
MHESIEHQRVVVLNPAKVNAPYAFSARISPHVTQLPQFYPFQPQTHSSNKINILTIS